MNYRRMPIEIESPEQMGYENIKCNLTESSVTDMRLQDLGFHPDNLVLAYTDHAGKPQLREAIAAEGEGLTAADVLITPGAAAALFIAATSLLKEGDRVLVARPNYATNIETPRAIGCKVDYLDLEFDSSFKVDLQFLENMITKDTKLVSLTSPHNPTGSVISESELRKIIEIIESKGTRLLLDETYREMNFDGTPPLAATLSPRAISVSSVSKSYGMPGIRIGWFITRDPQLQETFLAAKEQIFICNSVIDEEIAAHLLINKQKFLPPILEKIKNAKATVTGWMKTQPALEWIEPRGGVVCFPRIKDPDADVDRFYKTLNEDYKTHVGPGHWFEMTRRHMRIGFGWPSPEELKEGLENISKALAGL